MNLITEEIIKYLDDKKWILMGYNYSIIYSDIDKRKVIDKLIQIFLDEMMKVFLNKSIRYRDRSSSLSWAFCKNITRSYSDTWIDCPKLTIHIDDDYRLCMICLDPSKSEEKTYFDSTEIKDKITHQKIRDLLQKKLNDHHDYRLDFYIIEYGFCKHFCILAI